MSSKYLISGTKNKKTPFNYASLKATRQFPIPAELTSPNERQRWIQKIGKAQVNRAIKQCPGLDNRRLIS